MGFRRSDLQEAFFVPGTHPFRVWGYGTTDPLEELLGRDYFRAAGGLMHPGDLIYISVRPRPARAGAPETGETRMALVMVRGGDRGAPAVRLVQDLGGPDDPDAPPLDPGAPKSLRAAHRTPAARRDGRRAHHPGRADQARTSKRFALGINLSASCFCRRPTPPRPCRT